MDFSLTPEIKDYQLRIGKFVRDHLVPIERDPVCLDEHEFLSIEKLAELRAKARAEGLWAFQMPKERGGQGLSITGMAACYEEANWSIFGPMVFNCSAPDDG